MNKRNFLKYALNALTGGVTLLFLSGCIASRISPTVKKQKTQAWRCGNCGHLTRSDQDLTDTRCPRCKRKGYIVRITEKELQNYLQEYSASQN